MKISILEPPGRGKEHERRGGGDRHLPCLHDCRRRPGERRFADHHGCNRRGSAGAARGRNRRYLHGRGQGLAPDGFDYGNSPFEIATVNLSDKSIIQRTSAGTRGIVAASTKADRLYAASVVTAEATVRALLSAASDEITIVAMGDMASSVRMKTNSPPSI